MTKPRTDRATPLSASRRWVAVMAIAIALPWLILGLLVRQNIRGADPVSTGAPLQAGRLNPSLHTRRGPWGELDLQRIITEPPVESVLPFLDLPPPTWHLKGVTREALPLLAEQAGLTAEQQAGLLAAAAWPDDPEDCVIEPEEQLIRGLSPDSRAALYSAMAFDPRNTLQYDPFRIHVTLSNEWLEGCGIPDQVIEQVFRLSYRRGKSLVFADPHLVLAGLPDTRARVRLLKALARQSSLLVRLRIAPGENTDALLAYWRRTGGTRDIQPLIESLARLPNGYWLDIIHLLPPLARKRLFSYPLPGKEEVDLNCHWTSMNFLNDPPDPSFAEMEIVQDALNSRYDAVMEDWRLGDVLLFMISENEVIHSAVYIADDIVFTKNGAAERSPWTLMSIETVSSFYESAGPISVHAYRRRPSE